MDTTGNEPQLGGQGEDNSPMISSVVTRAIASARGAYQTGNLKALLEHMEPAQYLTFRRAIVQLAYNFARPAVDRLTPSDKRYTEVVTAIELVERWLADPKDEVAFYRLLTINKNGTFWGYSEDHIEMMRFLLRAIDPNVVAPIYPLASTALSLAHGILFFSTNRPVYQREIRRQLKDWYVELAWAILLGKPLPTSPDLTVETIRSIVANHPNT
jgi:hypothetical protein